MIRHVVVFTWNDDTRPEQVEALSDALGALAEAIPGIRRYEFGPDVGLNDQNAQFAVVADLDDVGAFVTYRDHPAHQAVIAEHISPIVASRSAVQYEVP